MAGRSSVFDFRGSPARGRQNAAACPLPPGLQRRFYPSAGIRLPKCPLSGYHATLSRGSRKEPNTMAIFLLLVDGLIRLA